MSIVIATVGLHGSASTWVFNVAREVMIAGCGRERVLAAYADDVAQLPDEAARNGRTLVLKSHHGSAGLDEWLAASRATMLLSVRDPRDAALSMAQRFGAPLAAAVRWIANDCERLRRLAGTAGILFRYEDRFFDDRAAADLVARSLGQALAPEIIAAIHERYRTETVRQFARTVEALPDDRLVRAGAIVFDRETQIHRTHIGDGRSGKWRDLPAPVQDAMARSFRPFLEAFGYPA